MRARAVVAAVLVAAACAPLGLGSAEASPTQTAIELSGYNLQGRGSGSLVSYDIPGRLPISPVADVALPDVQSSIIAGPTPAAMSSLAYPGPLVLSLDTVFAQFGGFENPLPQYPAVVRAPSADGPAAEDESTVPGGRMSARAEGPLATASASMPGRASPGVADMGTVEAFTETVIEGPVARTHVRVEVDGIDLLGGVVRIDGLITDLTVTTDGATATTEGGTTLSGVQAFGLPAVIDSEGIRFAEPDAAPGTTTTTSPDPTGGLLGPVASALEPLSEVTGSAAQLLSGDPTGLDQLLRDSGITVRLAEPVAEVQGPAGSLRSSGLSIEFSSELDATPIGDVLRLIPPLPQVDGSPFQIADLIAIIGANHVGGLSFGSATASASARPLPERGVVPLPSPSSEASASPPSGGTTATPIGNPSRAVTSGAPSTSAAPSAAAPEPVALQLPFESLVGWRLVLLAFASALVASLGTRKLPDVALATGAIRSCNIPSPADRIPND